MKLNFLKSILGGLVKLLASLKAKLAALLSNSWKASSGLFVKAGKAGWAGLIKAIKWPWEKIQAMANLLNPFKRRAHKVESSDAVTVEPVMAAA